jgi:hypothetical protein
MVESMGYVNFYLFTTVIALPGIILFWLMSRAGLIDASIGTAGIEGGGGRQGGSGGWRRGRGACPHPMIFIVASILIQLACAVHIVRNGRNPLWLTVVVLLSIPGCLAYFFVEVLPSQRHNRSVRAAGQIMAKKVDPERDIRTARERLEIADTAANHSLLGDALAEAGRHAEAVPHYEAAIERQPAAGRGDLLKLAASLIESGRASARWTRSPKLRPLAAYQQRTNRTFSKRGHWKRRVATKKRSTFTGTSLSGSRRGGLVPLCRSGARAWSPRRSQGRAGEGRIQGAAPQPH